MLHLKSRDLRNVQFLALKPGNDPGETPDRKSNLNVEINNRLEICRSSFKNKSGSYVRPEIVEKAKEAKIKNFEAGHSYDYNRSDQSLESAEGKSQN